MARSAALLLACAVTGLSAQSAGVTGNLAVGRMNGGEFSHASGPSGVRGCDAGGRCSWRGALERVTRDAVTMRGGDGILYTALLPAQGKLRPSALVAAYHIGDEVELQAERIVPQFIAADSELYGLQAQALHLRRHGSGGELRAALNSPSWRRPGNLLALPVGAAPTPAPAPSAPSSDAFLEAARRAVLGYLADLPNFVVSESVARTVRDADGETTDHITSTLAVAEGQEQRSDVRLNGKPWPYPFAALTGPHWSSDFADQLRPIFLPVCGGELKRSGSGQHSGAAVEIYSFRLPPSLCAGRVQAGVAWAYPEFEGKVYISAATHLVVGLEERYRQLPASFEETSSQDTIEWAPAEVAGASWMLPARAQLTAHFRGGGLSTLAVSYADYRRFESHSQMVVVGAAK